jgi:two-component system response regulator DesR
MSTAIRVVLAEDQAMVLGALSALLELEADISVIATTANGRDAFEAVGRMKPDVLVTDIEMPHMTGLELAANLRTSHPNVRTIILTTFARPGYLRRALDAGARGYLLKDPHRPRTSDPPARRRRPQQHRDRDRTSPLRRHRSQLPLRSHRQTRCLQSRRRRPHSPHQGLALATP